MNILAVTTKCPWPLNEGRALRTYNLLKQASRDHDITLCTFVQSQEEIDGLGEMRKFCTAVHAIPLYMSWPRISLVADMLRELFSSVPIHAMKYARQSMRRLVKSLLDEQSFDVLHLDMLQLSELANIDEDIPVVLVEHNVESQILDRRVNNEKNPVRRFYLTYQASKLRRYEIRMCEQVDEVVTVSDGDMELLRELGVKTPITVVPNAVDVEFFQPSPEKPDEDRLVYVGSLAWFPNEDAMQHFIDDIMPLILKERPGVTLDVIGHVPNESAIAKWRDDSHVRFLGFVDDIRPIVHAASVYVVPLRIGGGTRLKILDAMAMGKALVTTSIGCEGLGLKHNEQALIADGPQQFADSVLTLLRDPSSVSRLGGQSRNYVCDKFRWEQIATIMDGVYRLAGKRRAVPGSV